MLINFFALLTMFIGLYCTLTPRLPGTLIIAGIALGYSIVTGFVTYKPWIAFSLALLALLAEVGGRVARFYFTRRFHISAVFSTNTTMGNIAGIIASDALFGPYLGTALWELIVGKALFPCWDMVSQVLKRLALIALFRFLCGLLMVIIIFRYILI